MKRIVLTFCCLLLAGRLLAQTCTTPGQTPATAFPVCGTATFKQTTVPRCGGRNLPSPSPCHNDGLTDVNPYWYKFTCFETGTLGFLIIPNNLGDDYDWQLYDVTNRDPNEVYATDKMVVASNWSGESGRTGASSAGTRLLVCGGYGQPLFSTMPRLEKGRNYLLLISHFTNTQSGYSLSFGGGTAGITDSKPPALLGATVSCGGDVLRIGLNKSFKCTSLAADGSDFYLTGTTIPVRSAASINCSARFDSDSLELKLAGFLQPGTYTLRVKKGADGNTLLDYCDNPVAETDALTLTILPRQPTPMDSLAPVRCAPQQLRLVFKRPILCSSISPRGSDFSINGSYPVSIMGAAADCNGTTAAIVLTLDRPLQAEGEFTISLRPGADGNTIIDECGSETPAGATLRFSVKDTVNAGFTYAIAYGCERDTIHLLHPAANGVNSWQWNLDDNQQSNTPQARGIYTVFNEKTIGLVVSNGFCSDTATTNVLLDNALTADFSVFEDNCPQEPVRFTGSPTGRVVQHHWNFGDGNGSTGNAGPLHTYAVPQRETAYPVTYTVTDDLGCQKTATKRITIYSSCYLAVPTAFTPNGDGRNDLLAPLNAVKAQDLDFRIYNRWGQLVFRTANWKAGWDGRYRNTPQPAATYVWLLRYVDRDTGKALERKGTAVLVR